MSSNNKELSLVDRENMLLNIISDKKEVISTQRELIERLRYENKQLSSQLNQVTSDKIKLANELEKILKTTSVEITPKVNKRNLTRQQRIFQNKVKHGFNITNIYQEARYILEEVAELMRAIEKNDRENMIEELADIAIFTYGCAEVARLGSLDAKIDEKMKINESREYKKTCDGDFVKTVNMEDKTE